MTKPQTTSPKLTERQMGDLFADAWAAGKAAGAAIRPMPMIVRDEMTGRIYEPVMDGACGFAWVNIRPGNSSFARYLVKQGFARSSYQGGVNIWISDYGQSYERKMAHAQAMAGVLEAAGFKAYGSGRLD